jgi:hypothetical protein
MVFVFYRTPAPHPWPEDYTSVLTFTVDDPVSTYSGEVSGAPAYIDEIEYPAVNITTAAMGIDGDYLYIRLDYAANIPPYPVMIAAEGNIEDQIVASQLTTIAFNTDGDADTGVECGAEMLLAVAFNYGDDTEVYGEYDFDSSGEVNLTGELGEGGMQYDYAILRYHILGLSTHFASGSTITVEFWSEAESDLYHHFAFEETGQFEWAIP